MSEPYRFAARISKNSEVLAVTIPYNTRKAMALKPGDMVNVTIEFAEMEAATNARPDAE